MQSIAACPLRRAPGFSAAGAKKRALIGRVRASMDAGAFNWDDAGALRVLAARMTALRVREEEAAAQAQLVDRLRAARPILPENVAPEEQALDFKLICDWHESSWAQLASDGDE